jgi:glycine cleavage system aminomethyltransferase T
MVALDIARIEAGLILIEVDYISSKKALIDSQRYSPSEIGLGKLVDLKKENFVGRDALLEEKRKGPARALAGLEIDWNEWSSIRQNWHGSTSSQYCLASRRAGLSRRARHW